jgi:ceramidase
MRRSILFVLLGLTALGAALLVVVVVPPIPQPQWYHNFADQRSFFGIPHFWNVISNLPFLLIGSWGIWYVAAHRSIDGLQDSTVRWMYVCFFSFVSLTGVGSAYYHWEPTNDRLVWDRLPISMMFMALFVIIITERLSRRAGILLFFPLVILGAASVCYWHLTETWGRGDLRPYLLAQIYPVVAIPAILWRSAPKYTDNQTLYSAIAWYAGAKLYEFLDKDLYSLGQILSGHTLKHIGAAVSCYMILSWIRNRRFITNPSVARSGRSIIYGRT